MELKICISPQFRAIDPPNPARGFIQQNENVRFATAACMQKYGNVSFATVACAKCMRYGGRGGGDPYHGGGGVATRDTEPYINHPFWEVNTPIFGVQHPYTANNQVLIPQISLGVLFCCQGGSANTRTSSKTAETSSVPGELRSWQE